MRTLLLGIAGLAFCLGIVVNGVHRQRHVIAALRARGAFVSVGRIPTACAVLERLFGERFRDWIFQALGEGYLEQVDRIDMSPNIELAKAKSVSRLLHDEPQGPPDDDADLKLIASLPRRSGLDELDLSCTRISDDGLRQLVDFPNLERLLLCGTDIDGRGFSHLTGLTKLFWLELDSTNVTDANLQSLPRSNLCVVSLDGTRITDAGIRHLSGLPRLMALRLNGTEVTGRGFKGFMASEYPSIEISLARCPVDDEGLRHVVKVSKLSLLDLSYTRITDASMPYLDELVSPDESFCAVILYGTSITDAGLRLLRATKGLMGLHLGRTAVTQAGADELARRLPQYKVYLDCDCPYCSEAAKTRGR